MRISPDDFISEWEEMGHDVVLGTMQAPDNDYEMFVMKGTVEDGFVIFWFDVAVAEGQA